MKNYRAILLCCALTLALPSRLLAGDAARIVMVHYMPWFASKPVSGRWGWHWTMDRFDPDKGELAARERPLIGPYDSGDPDALECHVLLMKFAGIDGAIVDWYGIEDYRDYAAIHRNTLRLIDLLRKAGLRFAICYEDQSVAHMVEGKALDEAGAGAHGKKVMEWLGRNWFGDASYLTVDGRPVLLVFGPQYFAKEQWQEMMADLPARPLLYVLPHQARAIGADGTFGWPPADTGKEVPPAAWRRYLRNLYARGREGERVIAAVFPGFHDVYQQAGVRPTHGYIDRRSGATFEDTLDLAWRSGSRLVQVVTWNDFGEDTQVEPTTSEGFRSLEVIQRRVRRESSPPLPFGPVDLRLPVVLYELRKQCAGDPEAKAALDQASALLFESKCEAARAVLEKVRAGLRER